MTIYMIGGSPCSGKSTTAEALSAKYGLHYFKVDDHLGPYMQAGARDGRKSCLHVEQMTPDQIWMRDPQVQCEEELSIYEEIFSYIMTDLTQIDSDRDILAEGAALLPCLAKRLHIPADRYLSITPTKAFQVDHYSQREWVPHVLADCSDKAKAFDNWMERDALFAVAVRQQCAEVGYTSLINDGSMPVEQLISLTAAHFGLG
ncbi:MAG: hypothetical protein J6K32_12080 [Clostridia bacterium]|nr:hypothetical protein [Clostridia bacterium]